MVIVYENKLLTSKDKKDEFYKIPGGRIEDDETGEETAIRELKEETGLAGMIKGELSTQILTRNPTTYEVMEIKLYHYKGSLNAIPKKFNDYGHNGHEVKWLDIKEIKNGEYEVAPNIKFLIEKGDIK